MAADSHRQSEDATRKRGKQPEAQTGELLGYGEGDVAAGVATNVTQENRQRRTLLDSFQLSHPRKAAQRGDGFPFSFESLEKQKL